MRVAFMGKGGSGKTTLAAAFTRFCSKQQDFVLAFDGDLNVHLGKTLGIPADPVSPRRQEIFDYLEGERNSPIIGVTPPSCRSRFILPQQNDPFLRRFATFQKNIALITVGSYAADDCGHACYHGKLGALEAVYHHLLDTEKDLVIADLTAGVDSLGTSLFFCSDLNVFVVEPTERSLQVFREFKSTCAASGIPTMALANKCASAADVEFVRRSVAPEDLIGAVPFSPELRAFDQGKRCAFDAFVGEIGGVLAELSLRLNACTRDWNRYYALLLDSYQANCRLWYNDYYNHDLTRQIDPGFNYAWALRHHVENHAAHTPAGC